MNVRKYLTKHQPIILKTMENAYQNEHISHAYLLCGERGTPLLPTALFFAKSLLCEAPINGLACEDCLYCQRIEDGNYADIIIVDGKTGPIKKEDILNIERQFYGRTGIESKGIMVYIINLVENMNAESVNALLKFLEEPSKNVFAFLTSENENKVLPTILSRTQILHFKNIELSALKEECVSLNIQEEDIDLLLRFYNDAELIKQMSEDDDFITAKKMINITLQALNENKNIALQVIHKNVLPTLKGKESTRFFLDILANMFQDIINIQIGNDTLMQSYAKILKELSKTLPHVMESFLEIMDVRSKIDMNLNISLLIDHLIIFILKGE